MSSVFSSRHRGDSVGRRTKPGKEPSTLSRRTSRSGAARWRIILLCKSHPTLRQARPRAGPEAAMRVRKISAQCVLQFTPSLAAGCVLHRPVSRVIHCSELYFLFRLFIALLRSRVSYQEFSSFLKGGK